MATGSRLGNLTGMKTAFFCCDMQERFRPAIKYFEDILEVANRLVKASKILGLPLVVSEQYPKGLGATVPELDISHAALVYDKTRFTMMVPALESKIPDLCQDGLQSVILFGIEAHVCVQQTALDLLQRGLDVHVIADATSSRSQMDRKFAFERLRQAGAIITTSEAVLLQLLGDKNHPHFKEVQGLIKVSAPESGLVSSL